MEIRTHETVSITDVQRRTKEIFARLENGEQEKLVVLRNNEISAVLIPVAHYEALLDELEDLRIEAIAADRIVTFDPAKAITHEDMVARFSQTDV